MAPLGTCAQFYTIYTGRAALTPCQQPPPQVKVCMLQELLSWCRAVPFHPQVAILIPFRNRYEHLPVLFRHLIPMLQRQRLQFAFYVVEQVSGCGVAPGGRCWGLALQPARTAVRCVPRGLPDRSHPCNFRRPGG